MRMPQKSWRGRGASAPLPLNYDECRQMGFYENLFGPVWLSMKTTTGGGSPALITALAFKLSGEPMNSNQARTQSIPAVSAPRAKRSCPRKKVK